MELYKGKKFSSDNEYAEAQRIESKMQKRFKAKEQNKDDVLQEDLDDLESTTDDEIEAEEARRSASCILQCYSKNSIHCKYCKLQYNYKTATSNTMIASILS